MKKSRKGIVVVVIMIALIAVGVIAFKVGMKDKTDSSGENKDNPTENGYRQIAVYEIEGTAKVSREGIGELEAYQDMQLQSKDKVTTEEESYLQMLMDEDKYLLLEPESVMSLTAEGDSRDSLTYITIEQGSITNTLGSSLEEDAAYEIKTPNATMAIRGTTFRVVVEEDENGNIRTTLSVFEGSVEMHMILPDQSVDEQAIVVKGGKEARVRSDGKKTVYEYEEKDVEYASLDIKVLRFLEKMVEKTGAVLSISTEELEKLIDEKMCEVTFVYEDKVFGKQKVEPGSVIQMPKLSPAETGAWNFDFSKKITENTTILWLTENN